MLPRRSTTYPACSGIPGSANVDYAESRVASGACAPRLRRLLFF